MAEWLSRQPRDQTKEGKSQKWQDSWWASRPQGFESLPRRHHSIANKNHAKPFTCLKHYSSALSVPSTLLSTTSARSRVKSTAFFEVITGFLFALQFLYEHFQQHSHHVSQPPYFFQKYSVSSFEISVVVASASIFSTSSKVVMLSRKPSFFKPFTVLYYLVVNPDYA